MERGEIESKRFKNKRNRKKKRNIEEVSKKRGKLL